MTSLPRLLLTSPLLILSIWIAVSILSRVWHMGTLFSIYFFVLWALFALKPVYTFVFCSDNRLMKAVAAMVWISAAAVVFSVSLLVYGAQRPAKDCKVMIVLGCQVQGTRPSLMLSKRIRAAAAYALEHPDVTIVVSGGQGVGEDISEAECMRRELVKLGVGDGRILCEDKSVDTTENLRFSAKIIREHGLGNDVILVTNYFHQYRACFLASKEGLRAWPVSAHTRADLAPGYWCREIVGLWRAWLLGY